MAFTYIHIHTRKSEESLWKLFQFYGSVDKKPHVRCFETLLHGIVSLDIKIRTCNENG